MLANRVFRCNSTVSHPVSHLTARISPFSALTVANRALLASELSVPRRPCSRVLMAAALDETWRPEEDQIIKLVVVTEGPK